MPCIRVLTFLVVSGAVTCIASQNDQVRRGKGQSAWVDVNAHADWYIARVEKEQTWEGSLQARKSMIGPGERGGLNMSFVTKDAEFPVYTAGNGDKVKQFLARPVRIRGKLVDLSKEGFGKELWIGY